MEDYDHVEDVGVIFPFTLASFLRPFHFNHCSFLGFLSLKAEVISINPICAGLVWLLKFLHILVIISGLPAYYLKPIFAMKP